jgi:hypothetical protein
MMKLIKWSLGVLGLVFLLLYAVAFWWPRPPDTTEARVFAADGAALDYCVLPELDGNGLRAHDIPKAYTPSEPSCHYTQFPMPVLEHCREPIAEGFPDMRGLWLAYDGLEGHMERIEQCGDRIVVTTHGIIHDFHADGTLKNGSRDTEGTATRCANTWASMHVDDNGVLNFHPFGISSITVVKRWMEGDELRWKYPKFDHVIKLRRICTVPAQQRVYTP